MDTPSLTTDAARFDAIAANERRKRESLAEKDAVQLALAGVQRSPADRPEKVTLPETPPRGTDTAAPDSALSDEPRAEANPQIELCKWWMRCGPRARREFLSDVKFRDRELWREIAEEPTRVIVAYEQPTTPAVPVRVTVNYEKT